MYDMISYWQGKQEKKKKITDENKKRNWNKIGSFGVYQTIYHDYGHKTFY